jgi:hypothetical protein
VQLFTLIGLIAFADLIRQRGGAGPPGMGAPVAPPARPLPSGRGWRSARTAVYGAQAMTSPGPSSRTMERPA